VTHVRPEREDDLLELELIADQISKVRAEQSWLEWERQCIEARIYSDGTSIPTPHKHLDLSQIQAAVVINSQRVQAAKAQRQQVLVRIFCAGHNPRRLVGEVFATPLGLLLISEDSEIDRQWGEPLPREAALLLKPPGPWWKPRVWCKRHGEASLEVEELVRHATKALRLRRPGRLPARFGTHSA